MTCAECQDLLLDLAYGELEAARAAEVEHHARGCATCAAALAELARTRTLVAPLGEGEEPPETLDAKILDAARTEAILLGGGTQGPVIAADVRVQPLAVEAAQIDARARVQASGPRRRPRWALRAALAGSVAAAGALAIVVSTGAPRKVVPRSDESDYRIQVRTADQARREAAAAAAPPKAAPEEPGRADRPAPAGPAPAPKRPASPPPPSPLPPGPPQASPPQANAVPAAPPAALARMKGRAAPESAGARAGPAGEVAEEEGAAGAKAFQARAREAPAKAQAAASAVQEGSPPDSGPAADPGGLERRAEASRRRGSFDEAAALYQEASRARAAAGDAAAAGWNLAHAVECLAAAGRFGEARAGRSELRTLYPDARGPQAATDRALRTAPAADGSGSDRAAPR
ncbi:MAG: hypothetical protein NVSMB23_21380 [Myxococcales bacterium]